MTPQPDLLPMPSADEIRCAYCGEIRLLEGSRWRWLPDYLGDRARPGQQWRVCAGCAKALDADAKARLDRQCATWAAGMPATGLSNQLGADTDAPGEWGADDRSKENPAVQGRGDVNLIQDSKNERSLSN